MNKKEVAEIKKQFKPENCTISRVCIGYVTEEKEVRPLMQEAFLSLPEEETFKYFDIFKKTLSGKIGKNLLDMEFPLEQEKAGGTQEFLLRLRDSKLKDEALLEEFYEKVSENYVYEGNYCIILAHAMYDIPGKASDGEDLYDASDEVYEYLICSICPVILSKPGLSYDAEAGRIQDRSRDWIVDVPDKGFLFPAFTDRCTDLHSVLYYTKNAKYQQPEFVVEVLGTALPLSADEQKEQFQALLKDILGDNGNYDIIQGIYDTVNELKAEHNEDPEPLGLGKTDIRKLLESGGVPAEDMERFDMVYDSAIGEKDIFLIDNIIDAGKFNIETPNITVKVNADRSDLVETKVVDGRQCLVIKVDDHIEVNGIDVRTIKRP